MTCDCKGCSERRLLCHSSCEKYAAFKEEVANANKNMKEYEDVFLFICWNNLIHYISKTLSKSI